MKTRIGGANQVGECREFCPGGNHCHCNGAVRHALHICNLSTCPCHTRQRYLRSERKVDVHTVAQTLFSTVFILALLLWPAQASAGACPRGYARIAHGCRAANLRELRCDSGYYGQWSRNSGRWVGYRVASSMVQQ